MMSFIVPGCYIRVGEIKGEAIQDLRAIHATVGVFSLDSKAIISFIMVGPYEARFDVSWTTATKEQITHWGTLMKHFHIDDVD